MSDRSFALPTSRFSLSGMGDAWQDCYITYTSLTPRDLMKVADVDPAAMDNQAGVAYVIEMAKPHVKGGKVALEDGTVADLSPDDLELFPLEVIRDLFTSMTGGALDPKDTPTAATDSSKPSTSANS